jgi:hypothetical protein
MPLDMRAVVLMVLGEKIEEKPQAAESPGASAESAVSCLDSVAPLFGLWLGFASGRGAYRFRWGNVSKGIG